MGEVGISILIVGEVGISILTVGEVLHPPGAACPLPLPVCPLLPAHQVVEPLQLLLQSTRVVVLDIYNEETIR